MLRGQTLTRPVTFLFNGGPGSSTVWLRMGAFGPVRVVTADGRHTNAPYSVVNNDQTLLDASDLVFIDAPGTGFSRIAGKDKEKSFYGVDQDIDAFTKFITQFLTKYGRWSSPKYVFGESYGTMRGAGLALSLQKADVDLNGLILLSDILNWDFMPDDPQLNPGIDMPYIVALPTYAATAWYHRALRSRSRYSATSVDQLPHHVVAHAMYGHLGKVAATRYTDRVMVRLVSGQALADFAAHADNLAHGFGAMLCRVRTARSGAVVLEFIRRDALAALVPALPIPANPDLKALPVGWKGRKDGGNGSSAIGLRQVLPVQTTTTRMPASR